MAQLKPERLGQRPVDGGFRSMSKSGQLSNRREGLLSDSEEESIVGIIEEGFRFGKSCRWIARGTSGFPEITPHRLITHCLLPEGSFKIPTDRERSGSLPEETRND